MADQKKQGGGAKGKHMRSNTKKAANKGKMQHKRRVNGLPPRPDGFKRFKRSKEHRACGPLGEKLRAENAARRSLPSPVARKPK